MLDEMCATLGGRASEEITFSKISTGALNDLERVTKQAYAMTSFFGMSSKIGNLSFYDSTGQQDFAFNKPYSEKTAEAIDEEVKELIDVQYERAKILLKKNKKGLKELADILLEKEVIFSDDLEKIFGKRPWITEETLSSKSVNETKTEDEAQETVEKTVEERVELAGADPSEGQTVDPVEEKPQEQSG